jgi:hypothetical protein
VVLALALVARAALAQPPEDLFADRWLTKPTARLEALDKVTGRVSVVDLAIDTPASFGTLDIVVRACHRRPPELPPDSAAFLEINESRDAAAPVTLFSGWMFASSPGLSTLEHPVYDVIVLECLEAAEEAEEAAATKRPLAESIE